MRSAFRPIYYVITFWLLACVTLACSDAQIISDVVDGPDVTDQIGDLDQSDSDNGAQGDKEISGDIDIIDSEQDLEEEDNAISPVCEPNDGLCCIDGQPENENVVCDYNDDPCKLDLCRTGVCTTLPIPNDCGHAECGSSPSDCYDCGTCEFGFICRDGLCHDNLSQADRFRRECLSETGVVCDATALSTHLENGTVAQIWWDLELSERTFLADRIIQDHLFFPIDEKRQGATDCGGGEGEWDQAVCMQNAIIRYLFFGDSSRHADEADHCYWRRPDTQEEHCYVTVAPYGLPVHPVSIVSEGPGYGHSVAALQMQEDTTDLFSWRLFQYNSINITPGNWQMPCEVDGSPILVFLDEVIDIGCDGYSGERLLKWRLASDCSGAELLEPEEIHVSPSLRMSKHHIRELDKLAAAPDSHIFGWIAIDNTITLFVNTPDAKALRKNTLLFDGMAVQTKQMAPLP